VSKISQIVSLFGLLTGLVAAGTALSLVWWPGMMSLVIALATGAFVISCVGYALVHAAEQRSLAAVTGIVLSVAAFAVIPSVTFFGSRDKGAEESQPARTVADQDDEGVDGGRGRRIATRQPIRGSRDARERSAPEGDEPDGAASSSDVGLRRESAIDLRGQPKVSEASAVRDRIDALAAEIATLSAPGVWERVAMLRDEAEALEDARGKTEAHLRLDRVIFATLDQQAQAGYARAHEAYAKGDYKGAMSACEQAMEVYRRDDIPELRGGQPTGSPLAAQIHALQVRIQVVQDLLGNPEKRFAVRGFLKGRRGLSVTVQDLLTNESQRLEEGDRIEGYAVKSIDDAQGQVVLEKGGRTVRLSK